MSGSEIIQYTVQPGDTLWDLAAQYNSTVDDMMAANPGLDPEDLMIGDVIAIPDPPPEPRFGHDDRRFRRRPPFRPVRTCPGGRLHFVNPGDTLFRIAMRYGVSVGRIVARNPQINFNFPLMPGDVVCIPFR